MKFLKFNTIETKNIDKYVKIVEERLDKQWEYNKEVFRYDYYMDYEELSYYTDQLVKSDIDDVLYTLDDLLFTAQMNHNIVFNEFFKDILSELKINHTGCTCMFDKEEKLRELYEFFELNYLMFNFPYGEILENAFKNFHFLPWQKENLNTEGYELAWEIEQFLLSRDPGSDEGDMELILEGGILDTFLSSQGYDIFGELDEEDDFIKSFLDELRELPIGEGYGYFLSFYGKINLKEYIDKRGFIESITFKKDTIVGIGNDVLHGGFTLYGIKLKKDLTLDYNKLFKIDDSKTSGLFYCDEVIKAELSGS